MGIYRLEKDEIPACYKCGSENTIQIPMTTVKPVIECEDCGHRFHI